MNKYLVILNPVAGNGEAKMILPILKKALDGSGINYEVVFSNKKGNITELAKNAVDSGFTDIIAVGGDGTVLEAFNGMLFSKARLGIIPAGTGNDFARTLMIPRKTEEAIELIVNGHTKVIDVGKVNDSYFLNVVGVGIDGEIVKSTEKIKTKIAGPAAYVMGTFKTLVSYKCKDVKISIDDETIMRNLFLVAIGNGKFYGGGMKITPGAEIDDGKLEICIVNKLSKLRFTKLFSSVFSGNHKKYKEVEIFEGKKIIIDSNEKLPINADGNIIGLTPCCIEIIPKALEVYCGSY